MTFKVSEQTLENKLNEQNHFHLQQAFIHLKGKAARQAKCPVSLSSTAPQGGWGKTALTWESFCALWHHQILMTEFYLPRTLSGKIEWNHFCPPCCPGGLSQTIRKTHREWESPKRCLDRDFIPELLGIVITDQWSPPQEDYDFVPVKLFFLLRRDSGGKNKCLRMQAVEGPP